MFGLGHDPQERRAIGYSIDRIIVPSASRCWGMGADHINSTYGGDMAESADRRHRPLLPVLVAGGHYRPTGLWASEGHVRHEGALPVLDTVRPGGFRFHGARKEGRPVKSWP